MENELKENVLEWYTGYNTVGVTLSQKKYINKIRKLAEKYPDSVKIVETNADGSIFAYIPLSFVKISAPPVREITEEQKDVLRNRLQAMRESNGLAYSME